jgi:hypothetical protein
MTEDLDRDDEDQNAVLLDWWQHVDDIGEEGLTDRVEASASERVDINQAFGGQSEIDLLSLICDYSFKPHKLMGIGRKEAIRGQFSFEAKLRQTCVITLEPLENTIAERFTQDFVIGTLPADAAFADTAETEDPFADEPPLEVLERRIVFGPLVYEYLSMAIDPHPRKPGALYDEQEDSATGGSDKPPSPFAVLKDFKPRGS